MWDGCVGVVVGEWGWTSGIDYYAINHYKHEYVCLTQFGHKVD